MSTSGEALGDGEVLAAFNGELRTLKDGVDRTRRLLDQTRKLVRYQRELLNTTRGAADAAGTSPGARAAVLDTQRMRRRVEAAGLTPRQHEILLLVAKGLSTKEIGKELWLSP